MLILSLLLIVVGLVISLLGIKVFKVALPLIGLVSGSMAGFIGVQAVFGTSVVAIAIALTVAVVVGVLLALLSYVFFDLAVIVYIALLGAAAFSYLGVALGLSADGFLVFVLALAGGILAAVWASQGGVSMSLVIAFTSFVGVAYVLAGFMLVFGGVTLDELNDQGVSRTILDVVDQSFIWFFVWFGASLIAMQVQLAVVYNNLLDNDFEYTEDRK